MSPRDGSYQLITDSGKLCSSEGNLTLIYQCQFQHYAHLPDEEREAQTGEWWNQALGLAVNQSTYCLTLPGFLPSVE